MKKHQSYIERNDLKDATHFEVSVYYTKGGTNYFSGGITPRGYYVSVTPVTKGNGTISYTMFTGHKRLLLKTTRYSQKQFIHALELAKGFEEELIAAVVAENKAA